MKCARLFLVLAAAWALAGCSGGGGSAGGNNSGGNNNGGFLSRSLGLSGSWRGTLGRAVNDEFDADFAVSGSSVTGTGRLTSADGTQASVGQLTGNFSGTGASGPVAFTVSFSSGPQSGKQFTYNGSLSQLQLSGSYRLAEELGSLTMSKVADVNVSAAGTWTSSSGTFNGQSVPLNLTFVFTQTGDQIGGTLKIDLTAVGGGVIGPAPIIGGTLLGNKITFSTNDNSTAIALINTPTTMTLTITAADQSSVIVVNLTKH